MNNTQTIDELIEFVNSGKLAEQWKQQEKLQAAIWSSIMNNQRTK